MTQESNRTTPRLLGLRTLKGALQRLSVTMLLMLLTTATVRAQLSKLTYNTAGGYYEIWTVADLQAMANYYDGFNGGDGKVFKMMQDIDMAGVNTSFLPIASTNSENFFGDVFDGNSYAIKNLSLVRGGGKNEYGLFSRLASSATVKDLTLKDCDVRYTGTQNYVSVGAIAGVNYGTIQNCTVIGTVGNHDNQYDVGAVVGCNYSPGKVKDCTGIAGQPVVGTLYSTGATPGTVTNCNTYYRLLTTSPVSLTTTPAATIVAGVACYTAGTALALTVTPHDNTQILTDVTFTGATATKTGNGQYTLTMPANDVSITATFSASYTISGTGSTTGGSIIASQGTALYGDQVTLTATPSTGYSLQSLTVTTASGQPVALSGSGLTRTFTMPGENVTVSATFALIQYTVHVTAYNCTATASPNPATMGQTVTVSITPDAGSVLQSVNVRDEWYNLTVSGSGNTRTFTMPATDAYVIVVCSVSGQLTGQGTQDEPYLIFNEADLRLLSDLSKADSYYDNYFRLENDITMGNTPMAPIGHSSSGTFGGYFDGNGHTISNLHISGKVSHYTSLFGHIYKTISNLTLANCTIEGNESGTNYTGGIAGYNTGTITGCHVTGGTVSATSATRVGGIVGENDGTITGCTNGAAVSLSAGTVDSKVGGIVGYNVDSGTVKDCTNTGSVSISGTGNTIYNCGGIVGYLYSGIIGGCANTGNVSATGSNAYNYAGGVAGYIYNSKNAICIGNTNGGAVNAANANSNYAGGIVGCYKNSSYILKNNYYFGACAAKGVAGYVSSGDAPQQDITANYGAVPGMIIEKPAEVTLGSIQGYADVEHPAYAVYDETISFTVNPAGGFLLGTVKLRYFDGSDDMLTADDNGVYSFTMPSAFVTIVVTYAPDPEHFAVSGDEYTIKSTEGWNAFCYLLEANDQGYFTGKTVKLDNDISVTRMAGSEGHEFTGTFDGDGHTLTVSYGSANQPISEQYAAPFRYAGGIYDNDSHSCTIKNLRVAGTIYTSAQFAAGFVGFNNTNGYISLENCRSSVVIRSTVDGDGTHGGFVARRKGDYTLNIRGCLFDGEFHGTNTTKWGGFVGYRNSGYIYMYHSIFAPTALEIKKTESATFIRNGINNYFRCYYTEDINDGEHYTGQGHRMRSITPGTDVTVGLNDSPAKYYEVSDITNYGSIYSSDPGLKYGDTYYAGSGEEVSVTLSASRTGYVASGYTASNGGTVSGNATDGWTITMPDANVTVNANFAPDPVHLAVSGNEYTIKTATGWNVFCDLLANNAKGYFTGKTVTLGNDIPTAEEKAAGTTAVTRMAGSSGKDFTGTFNGGGYTLTVGYEDSGDNTRTAPFAYVDGATIQDLIIDGSINDTGFRAAGVIGETNGSTSHITNCVSSLTISGGRYTGGFSIGGNVEIEGCVFNGKINGSILSGGFVGYSDSKLKIINSLFAPKDGSSISGGTFYYNGGGNITPTNSYYTEALGTAQGNAAYVYTPATTDFVPANVGAEGTAYDVSGITAYATGLKRNGKFYLVKASVNLADNSDNSAAIVNKQVADVTLSGRKLWKDGDWNTLCLPFSLASLTNTPLEGATVMELDTEGTYNSGKKTGLDGTTLYLYFKDATSIEAGVPYIVKWPATTPDYVENPCFTGVTVENGLNDIIFPGGAFKGTYAWQQYTEENKSILLLGTQNTLYWPKPDGNTYPSIGACRAYFELSAGVSAREFVLNFDGDYTTRIISTTNLTNYTNSAGAWFDLSGRKLDTKPTKKGVYIHEGRKIVIP